MKNPINVIDQELIDTLNFLTSEKLNCDSPIEPAFANEDPEGWSACLDWREKMFDELSESASQLLTMAVDLIEINAELTKELQKIKGDL